jgi:hypothetical protein
MITPTGVVPNISPEFRVRPRTSSNDPYSVVIYNRLTGKESDEAIYFQTLADAVYAVGRLLQQLST